MSNYTFMLTAIAALIAVAALLAATTIVMRIALRSPLGDSPWFWVCVFSTSAAVALFVMDGKYRHRQDHIENAYLYGTKTLAKPTRDATFVEGARIERESRRVRRRGRSAGWTVRSRRPTIC